MSNTERQCVENIQWKLGVFCCILAAVTLFKLFVGWSRRKFEKYIFGLSSIIILLWLLNLRIEEFQNLSFVSILIHCNQNQASTSIIIFGFGVRQIICILYYAPVLKYFTFELWKSLKSTRFKLWKYFIPWVWGHALPHNHICCRFPAWKIRDSFWSSKLSQILNLTKLPSVAKSGRQKKQDG